MPLQELVDHLWSNDIRPMVVEMQLSIADRIAEVHPTPESPSVYFMASYDSLQRIVDSEQLLPRNALKDSPVGPELSSSGAQGKRNKIYLGDGHRMHPPRQIHDCLNFFFNPSNTTTWAFCHNQLILHGAPLAMCIIEFPLESLAEYLETNGGLWACSNKNLASGAFTSGKLEQLKNEWSWKEIFDVSHENRFRPERSAEFILWLKGGRVNASAGLPFNLASTIIDVPGNQNQVHDGLTEYSAAGRCFPTEKNLLRADRAFNLFVENSELLPQEALASFETVVSAVSFELSAKKFANPDLASSGYHGIPHVTRVMFWTHVLTHPSVLEKLLPENVCDSKLSHDSLLAAMIHDLRRTNHQEDLVHGEDAAQHYKELITNLCSGNESRVRRIMEAVTWHCRSDRECPNPSEPVFKILKDADALDRGRFGMPCGGSDFSGTHCLNPTCKHKGCAFTTLRLNYPESQWSSSASLAMAAWNLARTTSTAPWPPTSSSAYLAEWISNSTELVKGLSVDDSGENKQESESSDEIVVHFKCPELEDWVRYTLSGENEGKKFGKITRTSLAAVNWIGEHLGGEPQSGEAKVAELTGLEYATNLRELILEHYNQVSDLKPLTNLTSLTTLILGHLCKKDRGQITDVTPLRKLINLEHLYLNHEQIVDITPLANLTNLTSLELGGNNISDVKPLAGLKKLRKLYLGDNPIPKEQIEMLKKALPNCRIANCIWFLS